MKQLFKVFCALAIAVGLVGCIAAPIEMTAQTEQRLRAQPPIRFLLTFDDGPSASSFWNPTITILDSLATNPVQPNLKAVFFVQTGAPLMKNCTEAGVRTILRASQDVDAAMPLSVRVCTDEARVTQYRFVSAANTSKYIPSAGGSPMVELPSPARKSNVPTACPRRICHVVLNVCAGLIVPTDANPRRYMDVAVLMLDPVSRRKMPGRLLSAETPVDVPLTIVHPRCPTMPVVYPPAMKSSRIHTCDSYWQVGRTGPAADVTGLPAFAGEARITQMESAHQSRCILIPHPSCAGCAGARRARCRHKEVGEWGGKRIAHA